MGERAPKRGESTRDAIVEAALRLFAEHGYEGTSISDVLAATELSRGALYHHFADKQELFVAALERLEARMVERIACAATKAASAEDALDAGGRAFLELARDPTVRRIALLEAPAALGWERWRRLEERYGLGLIKTSLHAARPARSEEDIAYGAHVLMATLIELGLLIARSDDRAAAVERAEQSYARVLAAIVAG